VRAARARRRSRSRRARCRGCSRIAHALILRLHPYVTIWFHQHLDMVWASGGDRRIEKLFAPCVWAALSGRVLAADQLAPLMSRCSSLQLVRWDERSPWTSCTTLQRAERGGDRLKADLAHFLTARLLSRQLINRKSPVNGQKISSGPGRIRTCDLGIKSPLLYQLNYRPASAA
jgi:hypothetical protein